MGANSLPMTVTRQRRDCDLNPGSTAPKSSTLTTRLPSHPTRWVEHSNLRFEYIRLDSLCESIRFVKKSAFRFTSCHAVFLAYLLYSISQKNKLTSLFAAFNALERREKNSYAMHAIKITPYLLFEYRCTSGKFIRSPNRIESKLFCPNWNAHALSTVSRCYSADGRALSQLAPWPLSTSVANCWR